MDEINAIELDRVRDLLAGKQYAALRAELEEVQSVDIAEIMDDLEAKDTLILFRLLHKDVAADVFAFLSSQQQQAIVESMSEQKLREIIAELFFDDKIDFLEEMPASVVKRVIKTSSEEERRLINQFLNYPEDCAGSIMTIEHVSLKKEMTVRDALKHIKRTGLDKEIIYTCYVLNESRVLEGTVSLRKLVLADGDEIIGDIMNENVISVSTLDDQEEVAYLVRKYDLLSIPVVDKEHRLVGIITFDDIMDVIEEESTEDFHKMALMSPIVQEYLEASPLSLARKRIPWLLLLMVSATFTATVIGTYEDILAGVVILAAFIPMLMGTAGNAGFQSSTLVIRGMALGEIELTDYLKVFSKELRVGAVVGTSLGLVNLLRMLLFGNDLVISVIVSISLGATVIMAKLLGGSLPIVAKLLRVDPAIMAGPMITTFVDVLSLLVYFNVASSLLGGF